jgi:hypothetical protein
LGAVGPTDAEIKSARPRAQAAPESFHATAAGESHRIEPAKGTTIFDAQQQSTLAEQWVRKAKTLSVTASRTDERAGN